MNGKNYLIEVSNKILLLDTDFYKKKMSKEILKEFNEYKDKYYSYLLKNTEEPQPSQALKDFMEKYL